MSKISDAEFAPIKAEYSDDVKRIVTDCLQKNPAHRPTAQSLLTRSGLRQSFRPRIPSEKVRCQLCQKFFNESAKSAHEENCIPFLENKLKRLKWEDAKKPVPLPRTSLAA